MRYKYNNPPIEEALCEFRFAPSSPWNLTVPGLFYERIKDAYPGEPRQQNLIQTQVQLLSGEVAVTPSVAKLLFQSADTKKLVGVGPHVLSVHSLRPYEGWEHFYPRINQSFRAYLDVVKPIGVTRIAVRYINRIAISVNQNIELSKYFTIYPQLPNGIPSKMSGFLNRTESIYEDIPIKLTISLADVIDPIGQAVFILDLETSQDWVEKPLALEEAFLSLEELKQREGQVFESLITDHTRKLFDAVK